VWPGWAKSAFIGYDKLLTNPNGRFVQASVSKVCEGSNAQHEVEFSRVGADGTALAEERASFDFVVLATGSAQRGPTKPDVADSKSGVAAFEAIAAAVKDAGRITIAGGGAVGVELAFEIVKAYPKKEVTIVHSGDRLFSSRANNYFHPSLEEFAGEVKTRLEAEGVRLILGHRVEAEGGTQVVPGVLKGAASGAPLQLRLEDGSASAGKEGASASTDLLLNARGAVPMVGPATASDWAGLKEAASGSRGGIAITKEGFVARQTAGGAADAGVVPLSCRLFALGDCALLDGMTRTAYQAKEAAPMLIANIKAVATALAGEEPGSAARTSLAVPSGVRLQDLKVLEPHAMIPIGNKDGMGLFPGGSRPPAFLISFIKAKDLMTAWTAGDLKATSPALPAAPTGSYAVAEAGHAA